MNTIPIPLPIPLRSLSWTKSSHLRLHSGFQTLRVTAEHSCFEVTALLLLCSYLLVSQNPQQDQFINRDMEMMATLLCLLKYYHQKELALYFSFLKDTVYEEITFGWPRQKANPALTDRLALNLQKAINSVGLNRISLNDDPHTLSGGFKRRLALAIQLVQKPDLLLLDEPLAGLDWKARIDVVKLLKRLKEEVTLLVVSHDLKELSALVDLSWRMEMGGVLRQEPLPI